ncbi:holo-ACP synthase [Rickettsiales endosymbiont of Stachyamoeba lipophora]|uniref:holo-ACP synthase n=1 Tax=Rickettsiales endosymbiont of Stachyamoeba lipophora TaxID=2486578 RepID=UPI000F647763|nr:holo-ACP synthase [Rickettsiales endosymbiont of Stachyamoeba lipophora]AZL16211.1 holo-[acyl-carrier-protein] synthase [Rickettsiales endosymbiont of Stachyamoeba lipophora]
MILGLGTDIVNITRFERLLDSKLSYKLDKIFTQRELDYCFQKSASRLVASSLAARFAAKESFVKALGCGFGNGIYLTSIEVLNNALGKPELVYDALLLGKLIDILQCRQFKTHISLSHDYPAAYSTVIIENM